MLSRATSLRALSSLATRASSAGMVMSVTVEEKRCRGGAVINVAHAFVRAHKFVCVWGFIREWGGVAPGTGTRAGHGVQVKGDAAAAVGLSHPPSRLLNDADVFDAQV